MQRSWKKEAAENIMAQEEKHKKASKIAQIESKNKTINKNGDTGSHILANAVGWYMTWLRESERKQLYAKSNQNAC